MPRVFKIGSYWIYFWSNEGRPLEPVHVHVTEGKPTANATKIWLTREGKCILEHNNSNIKENHLKNIMRVIENQKKWFSRDGKSSSESLFSSMNSKE